MYAEILRRSRVRIIATDRTVPVPIRESGPALTDSVNVYRLERGDGGTTEVGGGRGGGRGRRGPVALRCRLERDRTGRHHQPTRRMDWQSVRSGADDDRKSPVAAAALLRALNSHFPSPRVEWTPAAARPRDQDMGLIWGLHGACAAALTAAQRLQRRRSLVGAAPPHGASAQILAFIIGYRLQKQKEKRERAIEVNVRLTTDRQTSRGDEPAAGEQRPLRVEAGDESGEEHSS